ncbi:ABC-three component system protein [Streptacidiphilus sp. ASG 303]|uniref:ABC-three component system protein n=1 Tax=Streptacidiphilus sp. ASG 303 TaxID=2896847 RepID=UPI001E54E392|nr:ABC-three component system protein [Streptacidiphilus sp. ASG 303]
MSEYTIPAQAAATNRFDTRTPLQQVYFWKSDEWEQFAFEWVKLRASHEGYAGVEMIGGSNDRGADVVAFFTEAKLNGPWHCFQCKHYQDALQVADAMPEMLKPFVAKVETTRTLPTRYTFVAPRIHPRLTDIMLTPKELKRQFLGYLNRRPDPVKRLDPAVLDKVHALAEADDFTWFYTVNLSTILEVVRDTPLYVERFNLPPAGKPKRIPVPDEPDNSVEARFVEQLLQVYRGYYSPHINTFADALEHEEAGDHVRRQRQAFYAAESVRMYARDSLPGDPYRELQEDVLPVLLEVAAPRFPTGFDRLQEVLVSASKVEPHSPMLKDHLKNIEKMGMCHQFANVNGLVWCRKGDAR